MKRVRRLENTDSYYTCKQIAAVLGLTDERVRQIEKRAIAKIKAKAINDKEYRKKLHATLETARELRDGLGACTFWEI